jgi:ABC-type sugar transport system permease subunit
MQAIYYCIICGNYAFEYTDIGKSSALTVILIAIMLLFTITNFVLSERREEKANAK